EDTLGLRHGPMAAINEKTLFGLFASAHPYRRRYETDLLREVDQKGLGLARLVVCPHPEPEWEALADVVVAFDRDQKLRLPDAITPPLAVVVGQLLALHKSLALGLTPDRPSRKGVINRAVQGVHIYPYPAGASAGGGGASGQVWAFAPGMALSNEDLGGRPGILFLCRRRWRRGPPWARPRRPVPPEKNGPLGRSSRLGGETWE